MCKRFSDSINNLLFILLIDQEKEHNYVNQINSCIIDYFVFLVKYKAKIINFDVP